MAQYDSPPEMVIDPAKSYSATIETSAGTMVADLFAAEVPRTVNNFVFLGREGYYDGVIFHRVISGFMIQGGDPTGTGRGGPGYRFDDEPVTRKYTRGTLAMANAGPNTNGIFVSRPSSLAIASLPISWSPTRSALESTITRAMRSRLFLPSMPMP